MPKKKIRFDFEAPKTAEKPQIPIVKTKLDEELSPESRDKLNRQLVKQAFEDAARLGHTVFNQMDEFQKKELTNRVLVVTKATAGNPRAQRKCTQIFAEALLDAVRSHVRLVRKNGDA